MTAFKTPSRAMAGFITIVLLALYGVVLLAPLFRPEVKFDPSLTQTLLVLLVSSSSYYLGSSQGAKESGDALRQVAVAAGPTGGGDGKPMPVTVENTPAKPVPTTEAKEPT